MGSWCGCKFVVWAFGGGGVGLWCSCVLFFAFCICASLGVSCATLPTGTQPCRWTRPTGAGYQGAGYQALGTEPAAALAPPVSVCVSLSLSLFFVFLPVSLSVSLSRPLSRALSRFACLLHALYNTLILVLYTLYLDLHACFALLVWLLADVGHNQGWRRLRTAWLGKRGAQSSTGVRRARSMRRGPGGEGW